MISIFLNLPALILLPKMASILENIPFAVRRKCILLLLKGIGPISSVQSLSRVQQFVTSCTAARQASQSITNSQSLLRLMFIKSMMPSNHLILCHPLLLPASIFPSIRVFSNESVLRIRWPKYWSCSFSISPSNQHSGLISFKKDGLISLQSKERESMELSRVFSNTTVQKHQFFGAQLSLWSNSHIHM